MFDCGDRGRPDHDTQSGEHSDVDHDGWKEAGQEGPARHRDHPGNLAGVDPQSRDQAARQHPEPARASEEAARAIDWTLDVESGGDLHQGGSTRPLQDLASDVRYLGARNDITSEAEKLLGHLNEISQEVA